MSNIAIQGLQDLLLVALDEISVMLGTREEDMDNRDVIEACNQHIENLGLAAGMSELQGLQLVCDVYQQLLTEKFSSEIMLENVLEWLFAMSNFIQTPSAGDVEILLGSFEPEQTEMLLVMLEQDQLQLADSSEGGVAQLCIVDDMDDEMDEFDEDEFSAESYKTVDIINMFLEEFVDVAERMQSLLDVMSGDSAGQEKSRQALDNYQELLARVILTTETLNLEGLGVVCKFVEDNISRVSATGQLQAEDVDRIKVLLTGWSAVVIEYLKMPDDDSACIQLVAYLENENWAEPLVYAQSQDILISLIEGLDGLDSNNGMMERGKVATMDDVALEVSEDASEALIDAFFHESPTLALEFSSHVEQIAQGVDVQSNTESAQRLAHTLKGSANLIGASGIANLTHHIEDILEYLARHNSRPPLQLAEVLQESADTVEAMIEALQGVSEAPAEALTVLQSVLDWANRVDQGDLDESTEIEVSNDKNSVAAVENNAVQDVKKSTPATIKSDVIQVPVSHMDEMFRLVGEMSIAMGQMQEQIRELMNEGESLNNQDLVVQQRRFELENLIDVKNVALRQRRMRSAGQAETRFDSLEMDQYDEVHGAVHSYIESVADSRTIGNDLNLKSHVLDGLLAQQNQLYNELQQIVMGTRMVPVSSIVARLQRSVRQASRATEKNIELNVTGVELQIDGDVLTKLTAPLMHMLRNAIDHGIESEQERLVAGKPAAGQINLAFTQQGNQVVVNCSDDGRGLDYIKIRSIAEQKGMISAAQPMTNADISRLILQPGFTTKDSATQISGRGVGMDVVNTAISELKGILNITDDETRTGSEFVLSLPITLVTNHSVLATVGDEMFAIPTSSLVQILTPGIGDYGSLADKLTYQLKDDIYPAKYLSALYAMPYYAEDDELKRKYTLLVRTESGITAVVVDSVVNSFELVVKDMGRYVKSVKGISGISVLGNGNVIPVLDLPEQLRAAEQTVNGANTTQGAGRVEKAYIPRVMVVDDSLSVRQSLSQLIEDAGFEVVVARDGIEAMDLIREQKPDIVLADMEMPRMNGLELTTAIRSQPETSRLPVIMITSRSMQKHRDEASRAGVSDYMTKPFAEELLLSNIQSYIAAA